MNKQRKVLITVTYNEMGIIIDTKAEEAAQPNLQPICNQLATDAISRQAAIEKLRSNLAYMRAFGVSRSLLLLNEVPSADAVEAVRCKDCRWWDACPSSSAAPAYHECHYGAVHRHTTAQDFCSYGERREGDTDG